MKRTKTSQTSGGRKKKTNCPKTRLHHNATVGASYRSVDLEEEAVSHIAVGPQAKGIIVLQYMKDGRNQDGTTASLLLWKNIHFGKSFPYYIDWSPIRTKLTVRLEKL